MTCDNVLSMLIIAEVCNVPLLKSVALQFLEENTREVMADSGRRKIIEDHPKIEGYMFEAKAREQLRKSSPDIDMSTWVEGTAEPIQFSFA